VLPVQERPRILSDQQYVNFLTTRAGQSAAGHTDAEAQRRDQDTGQQIG